MASSAQALAIVGAAEGSWYSAGKSIDLRYAASFANANSGLSFGTFQFDVATNVQAQAVFRGILTRAVQAKTIDAVAMSRIYAGASARNAKVHLKKPDVDVVNALLASNSSKPAIDVADLQRATAYCHLVDGMIAKAAAIWQAKKITAPILTPGGAGNLRLFAYLLANLNRRPDNQSTFQNWMEGKVAKTLNGPAAGSQLTTPPTIELMHQFFKSLRIWDGTQGNYQYLRDRLDPTLAKVGV